MPGRRRRAACALLAGAAALALAAAAADGGDGGAGKGDAAPAREPLLARVGLGTFAAVAGPLCVLIGASTALIGFTAWSLVVPLAITGLDYSALDAIFVSMACDFVDAALMTALLAREGRVDWRAGLELGVPAAAVGGLAAAFLSRRLVEAHESLLKGSVPVVVFLLAAGFLFRAVRTHRADLAARRGAGAAAAGAGVNGAGYQELADVARPADEEIAAADLPPTAGRRAVLLAGAAAGGLVGGVLGPGLAMVFVGLLVAVRGFDLLRATATAALVQALLMAATLGAYAARGYPNYAEVWRHAAVCVAFCAAGVLLGAWAAVRVKRRYILIYLVAATLALVGTGAVLQARFTT